MKNLMYHQIGKGRNSIGIDLKIFKKQLNHFAKLKKNFTLTFDHGTIDHYKFALPELNKRGLKGIFYILTMIQEDFCLPVEDKQRKLERIFKKKFPKIICDELDLNYNPLACKSFRNKWKFYTLEERYLRYLRDKILDLKDYKRIINKIFNKVVGTEKKFIKENYLSWAHIRKMLSDGHTIGSHSHYHVGDFEDYKHSLKVIQKRLDINTNTITYPNSNKIITDKDLKKLGIKNAYTTNFISKGSFRLGRIDCNQFFFK
jgi:peptidoglycan/xylan/chitin deacetylase (PgdA/CDA1 family)